MNLLLALQRFWTSSIGKKILVAVTGVLLLLFVFMHMAGNLLIYAGKDALNSYAEKLQSLGPMLWVARLGLLAAVGVHVVATIQLVRGNRLARPERYARETTVQATRASRTMIYSGLLVLAFVVYHVFHFTVAPSETEPGYYELTDFGKRHDVYHMVVTGFRAPLVSLFYVVSIGLLCLHLSHGFASVFQTLGLRTRKNWMMIRGAGYAFAGLVFAGNCSIPCSILLGWVS